MSTTYLPNGIIGSIVTIDDGDRLLFERQIGDGQLLIQNLKTGCIHKVTDPADGTERIPDEAWFEKMREEGAVKIVATRDGPVAPRIAVTPLIDLDAIDTLDPVARGRLKLICDLLMAGVQSSDPNLSGHVDRLWDAAMIAKHGPRPKTSTVRSWFGRQSGELPTLADMFSRSGRVPRSRRLDEEVVDVIDKVAPSYFANKGRRIVDVRAAINDELDKRNIERAALGLPPLAKPGKETVRLEVNRRLDRDTFREKWGESLAKSRWDGAGKTLRAHKILAVALIDDTTIDDVVVMDGKRGLPLGRPYLCVILDVHSRCVLGFVISFIPPTFHTAAECLKRANRPKSIQPEMLNRYPVLSRIGGRMATLIADDGSNYASPAFQDALADVGITLQLTPVGTPTHKAMLERFFRTLNTWLLQKLPGATFNPSLMRELDYDPEKTAAITLVELEMLIRQFINVYHITVHSGIDMQPALKWQTSMDIHGRDIIADERKLEILMGVTKRDRRLYRGAIRMFGLSFRDRVLSADLNDSLVAAEPHRKRLKDGVVATVTVKYNPANLSHVHVRNHVTGEWVSLPCEDEEYASGLSLWQHEQIRKWAKRQQLDFNTQEERLQARHSLNERILELAPDMAARERRAVARMLGTPIDRADASVLFAQAEPRHDGLAPVIENGDIPHGTNEDRLDADIAPSRPLFEKKRRDEAVDEDMVLDKRADDDGTADGGGPPLDGDLMTERFDEVLEGTDNEDELWKEYEL